VAAHKTLAFVLKTQDYRDTSLLVTFFSKEMGKIRAIVKGGRDGRGRLGSTLEPFSLNEILVYPRKRSDLCLVSGSELVEGFHGLRADLWQLGCAMYFLELVDALTDQGHAQPEIYKLLEEALSHLEGHPVARSMRLFEIKLMRHLGFLADLKKCVRCGLDNAASFAFSMSSGGVVCNSCRTGEGPFVFLSKPSAAFVDEALRRSWEEGIRIASTRETYDRVARLTRQFVDFHLHHKLKTLIFMEKISQAEKTEQPCTSKIVLKV